MGRASEGYIVIVEKTMAGSYLPLAEDSGRRSAGIVQHLATMLVGFGLGSAMIYAAGGQPLAVILPADTMAAQPAQGQFLQPLARTQSSMKALPPTAAHVPGANLQSIAEIQAYSPFNGKKY